MLNLRSAVSLRRPIRLLWDGLLQLLYPPLCLGCDAPVPNAKAPLCHRCLRHLERADPHEVSAQLARRPETQATLDGAFCLWQFDKGGTLQQVQHALKYGNRPRYGVLLGRLLGDAYQKAAASPLDGIVPVPLHKVRFYERGYNQSAELARGLSQKLNVPVMDEVLTRPHATRSQTTLSRAERWRNVRNAFAAAADPDALANQHLLLVDDLLTTGATATAAAQVLKGHGAQAVHLATLAMARA